jgi:hypothetical protein
MTVLDAAYFHGNDSAVEELGAAYFHGNYDHMTAEIPRWPGRGTIIAPFC